MKEIDKITKVFTVIYGTILLFSFLAIYPKTVDSKIENLGDNIYYYVLGQSLADGEGYVNTYSSKKEFHNQFPPGYPFIISLASKFFSNDLIFIKKLNGFFLFFSIILLFFIAYSLSGNVHLAFIVGMFSLMNFQLLYYAGIVMSEIPFLFFSLACVFVFIKIDFTKDVFKNWQFFVMAILVVVSYYIRSLGLALFISIFSFLLLKKYWKYAFTFIAVFIGLILPWVVRNNNLESSGYVGKIWFKNIYRPEDGLMNASDWVVRIVDNISRYITVEIPSAMFNYNDSIDYQEGVVLLDWITGLIIIAVMVYGLWRLKQFNLFILCYIIATMGILVLWPEVWNGPRFIIGILPLFIFLFLFSIIEVIVDVLKKVVSNKLLIYIGITCVSLIFVYLYAARPIARMEVKQKAKYEENYLNYFKLAEWSKRNVPKNAIVACRKPLLFHYFADRFVTGFKNTANQEEFVQDLMDKQVGYVVYESLGFSSTGLYLFPVLTKYPEKFELMVGMNEPKTAIFKFKPDLGYWGEWKELELVDVAEDSIVSSEFKYVKEGRGVFVYENGDKYVGSWANNLKEGNGKMYFKKDNGTYMQGVWQNDSLIGTYFVMSAQGDTLSERYYEKNKLVSTNVLN